MVGSKCKLAQSLTLELARHDDRYERRQTSSRIVSAILPARVKYKGVVQLVGKPARDVFRRGTAFTLDEGGDAVIDGWNWPIAASWTLLQVFRP